ncbi:DUF935 domain-containing protein [Endozoicomonas sp. SCSIO W0465]|uniref:DUF935 domain-containing protein n=1 Tax=Endozoicomonas sp. SCSIO W0465 TaxID=2918516 RepID=UPI002075B02D|nr:DUF935 domain-containing protein [Endozoicomonas sp. SCSIO W0465]USE35242.1 DUF935 domain-containing protein [Endozoicomonas sp. SCSIO W0465]
MLQKHQQGSTDQLFSNFQLARIFLYGTITNRSSNGMVSRVKIENGYFSATASELTGNAPQKQTMDYLLGSVRSFWKSNVIIELIEAARSGTADYDALCQRMDKAISKVILSQTMTTDDGSSRS